VGRGAQVSKDLLDLRGLQGTLYPYLVLRHLAGMRGRRGVGRPAIELLIELLLHDDLAAVVCGEVLHGFICLYLEYIFDRRFLHERYVSSSVWIARGRLMLL